MKAMIVVLLALLTLTVDASEIVFEGFPFRKVEITETTSETYFLTGEQSTEYKVTIVKEGDDYFWATRGNLQVIPIQSGFYITYLAVNGAGYVRTLIPEARNLFEQMPADDQAQQYFYFEHLVHQMGSITYYGRQKTTNNPVFVPIE
ncbi:hypothetical protein N9W78_01980 [bacterium]|nr:hypothetical protein [bacterium]